MKDHWIKTYKKKLKNFWNSRYLVNGTGMDSSQQRLFTLGLSNYATEQISLQNGLIQDFPIFSGSMLSSSLTPSLQLLSKTTVENIRLQLKSWLSQSILWMDLEKKKFKKDQKTECLFMDYTLKELDGIHKISALPLQIQEKHSKNCQLST